MTSQPNPVLPAAERWAPTLTIDRCQSDHSEDFSGAPTLVLGHSLGSGHIMWDELIPLLTPHLNVVRYDLPGHGGSPVAPISRPLDAQEFFAALARGLDEVGAGDVHIAGLSIGGLLALAAPHYLGGRVLSVACMNSGPRAGSSEVWEERIADVRANGVGHLVEPVMKRWFSDDFADGRGRLAVGAIAETYRSCDPAGYVQACEILASTDSSDRLGDIGAAVLVVSGESDPGFDFAAGEELAERLRAGQCPYVQHIPVTGVRHMSAMEAPHLIAGALLGLVLDIAEA